MSDRPLDKRVALVTGGGRGIGRAIAIGLAAAGASVAIASRTEVEIEGVRAEIEASGNLGPRLRCRRLRRARRPRPAREASARRSDRSRSSSTMRPSSGRSARAARSTSPPGHPRSMSTSSRSPGSPSRACPTCSNDGWGRIVNVSSGIAERPAGCRRNAYATSKAALEAHTLNLAAELDGTRASPSTPIDQAASTPRCRHGFAASRPRSSAKTSTTDSSRRRRAGPSLLLRSQLPACSGTSPGRQRVRSGTCATTRRGEP